MGSIRIVLSTGWKPVPHEARATGERAAQQSGDFEFRAAPDDFEAFDFVDGVADAFFFDTVAKLGVGGDEVELKVAAVIDGEKHPGRMLAALARLIGGGFDAFDGVHGKGILPRGAGMLANKFRG